LESLVKKVAVVGLKGLRGSRAVVLKRVPLSSPKKKCLIPGRKWEGKAVDEQTVSYYLFIQRIKTA